jgi:fluoride ion exporter CrcB/FEX
MMFILKKYLLELTGWMGAIISLSAFTLNSLNLLSSQSIEYLLMNIIGCSFLIVYAVSKKAYASWVLNAVWLLITAFALIRIYVAV